MLEAERQADAIVNRARKEAEEIVAEAHRRAHEIRGNIASGAAASRLREESGRQERLIADNAERQIDEMRTAAELRFQDAVERLLLELVGQP